MTSNWLIMHLLENSQFFFPIVHLIWVVSELSPCPTGLL